MIPSLSQETIAEYASEAQAIQEPTGADYTQGVKVGRTIPAKWWNWLFRGTTRRLVQAKTDAQNMLAEMQNVVTDAGIALDGSDSYQMSKSVVKDADVQIGKYVEDKKAFLTEWYNLKPSSMAAPASGLFGVKIVDETLFGLYLRESQYTSEKPWSIMCTTDLLSWHSISIPQDSSIPNPAYGVSFGIAHYKGIWWMSINARTIGSSSVTQSVLIKSIDLDTWETVFTTTSSNPNFVYGEGGLVVIDDTLYFSNKYTTDGESWTTTTAWHLGNQNGMLNGYPLSPEVIKIGSKYFAGDCYFDDTGWHTINPSLAFNNVCTGTYKGHITLSNGNIIMLIKSNGLEHTIMPRGSTMGTHRSSTVYVLDSSGNYINHTQLNNSDEDAQIVNSLVFLNLKVNNVYVVQYSTDGVNFADLADIIDIPVYLNGYYYSRSKADDTKLLKSADLVSWSEACNMPSPTVSIPSNYGYSPALQPTELDNGIVAYAEFLGDGAAWKAGRMNDYVPNFCGAVSFKLKDMFVSITNAITWERFSGSTAYGAYWRLCIAATYNSVNRVIGHTLYLR